MLATVAAGLGLGLSLIVAIGAQNAFVLRQGIRREHIGAVVLVCALSDALLIVAGVAGLGFALEAVPWLTTAARWAGAAFLVAYGLLAARRAWRASGGGLEADSGNGPRPRAGIGPSAGDADARHGPDEKRPSTGTPLAPVLLTAVAFTWLNPHVYLDTVFLVGSVAATYGQGRWLFAAGAMLGSVLWFSALGFGARYLSPVLRGKRAWRVLDGLIAVLMFVVAGTLVFSRA